MQYCYRSIKNAGSQYVTIPLHCAVSSLRLAKISLLQPKFVIRRMYTMQGNARIVSDSILVFHYIATRIDARETRRIATSCIVL